MPREGLLLHAGEETIHQPGEEEKKPQTPKSKWQNFWFYHKWHVIIGAVVCILAGFLISDLFNRVDPDYQIAVMSEYTLPGTGLEDLEAQLAQYGEDLNGDGKVVVHLDSYTIVNSNSGKSEDPQMQMASLTRLMANLPTGEEVVFLTDQGNWEYLLGEGLAFQEIKDGEKRLPVSECKGLNGLTDSMGVLKDMGLSFLDISTIKDGGKESVKAYAEQCQKLFDKLINGVPEKD